MNKDVAKITRIRLKIIKFRITFFRAPGVITLDKHDTLLIHLGQALGGGS